jgi:hypothetical protein
VSLGVSATTFELEVLSVQEVAVLEVSPIIVLNPYGNV